MNTNENTPKVFESTSCDHYDLVLERVRKELAPAAPRAPGSVEIGGNWYESVAVESISADVVYELESL